MNSGKYGIITLLSFTLRCVSNSFLLHPGLISVSSFPQADWLQTLSKSQPIATAMLTRNPEEQHRLGYFHALREICQQSSTWIRTGELIQQSAPALSQLIAGISSLTFSGSGSSDYAGDCVRMVSGSKRAGTAAGRYWRRYTGRTDSDHDAAIECQGLSRLGRRRLYSTVICVIAGQLSAFFRCLGEGLRPDSPFEDGVISRVVQTFALYSPEN